MFPGASAEIYYNEAGEPLGWDSPSYDEPWYDPDQFLPWYDPDPEDDDGSDKYLEPKAGKGIPYGYSEFIPGEGDPPF
jgi:hypothetical protein